MLPRSAIPPLEGKQTNSLLSTSKSSPPKNKKNLQQEYTYDPGLRDQNAITYLLKRDATVNMPHTQLVNRQYCLNCYWRDLLELGTLSSDDTRVHFINHFSGCQMCTQQNKNDDYRECESEYVKSYEYADSQFKKALVSRVFSFF